MEAQPDTTLIGATNRRTDLDAALLSRFDVRVHFPAPDAAGRAEIFGLYAKHLGSDDRSALGEASAGLSGRDILDVCRQAERRWVVKLLKGEVVEPPLPPRPQYEETLRRRLNSAIDATDDRAGRGRTPTRRGGGAQGRSSSSPVSLGPNSVGSWASRGFHEGGQPVNENSIRPPGW